MRATGGSRLLVRLMGKFIVESLLLIAGCFNVQLVQANGLA
jgi:hypothetical protein